MLIVKLDNACFGAGPGTVIGHATSVDDYRNQMQDRDGALDARLRLWKGDSKIGARVSLAFGILSDAPARPDLPAKPPSDIDEYRIAPSGEGPHASTWKDKPHRLIYDLCTIVEQLRDAERLRQSIQIANQEHADPKRVEAVVAALRKRAEQAKIAADRGEDDLHPPEVWDARYTALTQAAMLVEQALLAHPCGTCKHAHHVYADPRGTSVTGPGCLRTGGHAEEPCSHYAQREP